ncbi:MAG: hypothetical protein IH598_14210, partial [Bacteroidales bacterium]|nr:hypothetical protein [Bacteroidales bacterium]
ILPMIVYNLDKDDQLSPPSSTAVLIYFDFHGSWQLAARQSIYWGENKWRAFATVGTGAMNRRFFGVGRDTSVVSNDTSNYFWTRDAVNSISLSCYRKIYSGLYAGLEYAFNSHFIDEGNPDENDEMSRSGIKPGEKDKVSVFVPTFVWDNRNNIFWTKKGYYANLTLQLPDKIFAKSQDFSSISGWVNGYHNLFEGKRNLTLAWHLYFQKGWGELSYHQMATYGRGDHAMGYRYGKYVNNSEITTQVEVRKDVWKFVSLGGYFGTGKTFESKEKIGNSVWLHFGGLRTYFNIIPSRDIRLRLDFAFARKDNGFYLGIGQGF